MLCHALSRRFGPVLSLAILPLSVVSLVAAGSVVWPAVAVRAQTNAADLLTPGKGELIVVGKVLAVIAAENRLILSVNKVILADGTVTNLQHPVNKSVVLPAATSYYLLPDTTKKATLDDIKPESTVQALGRSDGSGSPLTARVIAIAPDPEAEQMDLRKSMPSAQNGAWWRLHLKEPAEAHGSIEKDGSYKVVVKAPGAKPSDVQIMQGGLKLQKGQRWHLHFRAKSDADRTLKLSAIVGGGDYHSIGLREEVSLESKWKAFDYTFTVDKESAEGKNLCPAISLGDKIGTVWISELSLIEVKEENKGGSEAKEGGKETPPK